MPTLPLADCARLLGIHPKTLHSWLKQADVPLAAHPRDARIKCLTEEHVEQLAKLHGRPLQLPATSGLASSEQQALPSSAHEAEALQAVCPLPTSFPQEADVIQKLSCLETKVATLQEQLAQLALALLQAQEPSAQRRLCALETLTAELGRRLLFSPSLPEPPITGTRAQRACTPHVPGQLNPAEQLARSRLPPLIEYSAQGTYVIICSRGAVRCMWNPIRQGGLSG